VARPARFELATLCFGAAGSQIPRALSSVAYGRRHSKICPWLGYKGYRFTSWHCVGHIHSSYPAKAFLTLLT